MGLTGHAGEGLAGADPGILNRCHSEYSGLVKVWILSEDESIGCDGANQWSDEGYWVFLRLCRADELKNGAKGATWFYLSLAILHSSLEFQTF